MHRFFNAFVSNSFCWILSGPPVALSLFPAFLRVIRVNPWLVCPVRLPCSLRK